ncbi:DUF6325 family protein [Nocardia yamanashiensis]|uniref:DUF6325 family protein n=1 Tax=Nocardia yamanashiensis TaxID=209247 RepID=UPI000834E46F|nr:DUF6325 family protein [Nocardia yamanashiensis]UGT42823.1 DUF6325 family protein [Nocardia yamanashiensis]
MAQTTSNLGPVELVVIGFPGTQLDVSVRAALRDVVDRGYVTVLDLVFLSKDANGYITEIDFDEPLDELGLTGLTGNGRELVSDSDLEPIRSTMRAGTSAVVVVYEETWARSLADTVRRADGDVILHVQVDRDALDAALASS